MTLPIKIDPCPIIDSTIELRLERCSDVPSDAVFGIIYSSLRKEYATEKKLPILGLPEFILEQNPDLKFKPYYKLSNESFFLQIGPNVISLGSKIPYVGWDRFFEELKKAFLTIHKCSIFDKAVRIGIRYINTFNDNIFENINLAINMKGTSLENNKNIFRTEIEHNYFRSNLQISNNAEISSDEKKYSGSVIDIDTHRTLENDKIDTDKIFSDIITGHNYEKELFFSLLKEEYVKSNFNPEYE